MFKHHEAGFRSLLFSWPVIWPTNLTQVMVGLDCNLQFERAIWTMAPGLGVPGPCGAK